MQGGNTHNEKSCLLLAYLFPPIGGIAVQRPLKFARYLGEHGWDVTVVTTKDVQYATMDESLVDEIPDTVDVVRVPDTIANLMNRVIKSTTSQVQQGSFATDEASVGDSTVPPKQRLSAVQSLKQSLRSALKTLKATLLVPDEMIYWALKAAFRARDIVREQGIDCIYTTAGPNSTHLAGLLVHWMTGVKWVADFRDPWTDNLHYSHGRFRTAFERLLEGQVFLNATAIITVTDGFKQLFDKKYPQYAHKVHVIRNGVDPSDFPVLSEVAKSEGDVVDDGFHANSGGRSEGQPFSFFYAGILYPDRTPTVFFEALHELIEAGRIREDEVCAEFAGVFDYPGHDDNRKMVARLHLENVVKVLGYQPRADVLRRMMTTDALLLVGDNSPSAGQYVPGKVYEYLYTKTPILALLPEGEAAGLVGRANQNLVIHSSDVTEVADAIENLIQNRRQGLSAADSGFDVTQFTRQAQTRELAELMDSMLVSSRMKYPAVT